MARRKKGAVSRPPADKAQENWHGQVDPATVEEQLNEGRESFLPPEQPEPGPVPVFTESQGDIRGEKSDKPISLLVETTEPRRVRIELTIPPLAACVENITIPIRCSDETLASIVAAGIESAASSAKYDGITRNAEREEEERAARERYESRA